MALHYQAASSSSHGHRPSRMSLQFTAAGPRTSSKRSFDEYGYGHSDVGSSSQPSASAAQISQAMATSSMPHDLALMPLDTDPAFGDIANNTHNTRFKRRRNSLVASPSDTDNAVRKYFPMILPCPLSNYVLVRTHALACHPGASAL